MILAKSCHTCEEKEHRAYRNSYFHPPPCGQGGVSKQNSISIRLSRSNSSEFSSNLPASISEKPRMSLMTVRGDRPVINTRAGSEGQLVVPATDEQPTPSARKQLTASDDRHSSRQPMFVEQWKSQWRAISHLAQAWVMRIARALFWQCPIGIFYTRLERISRIRSGDQAADVGIPCIGEEVLVRENLNRNYFYVTH